ncbi:MAG: hypothetical protein EOP91_01445 [Lysobacteraceae bacterium]|nr:MAG: hypothetical protein EOP91_01445 [Xanthomonadaceae bacterium]
MPSNLEQAAAAPVALSAFLRGVERRGALFAELQCGDRDAGDTALAAAMRAFRNHAAALPMSEWPRRFWALLVATPQLRQASAVAAWPPSLLAVAALNPSARQALLLRLAASLSEEEAAAVLDTPVAAYQQALTAACPRDPAGQPDAGAWRALAEAMQQQLRDLPADRLVRLAGLREAALDGRRLSPAANRPASLPTVARQAAPSSRRWLWITLVVLACAVALAATWWWPHWQADQPQDVGGLEPGVRPLADEVVVVREELAGQPPAETFDRVFALLSEPDFELLMQPEEEAIARDADFLAWYASGANALPGVVAEEAVPVDEAAAGDRETSDAQL